MNEDLKTMLISESATITALCNEIEHGDNDPHDFLMALRQVGYRLRLEAGKYNV